MARRFSGSTDKILSIVTPVAATPLTLFGRFRIWSLAAGSHSLIKLNVGAAGTDGLQIYVRTAGSVRAESIAAAATQSATSTNSIGGATDQMWHSMLGRFISSTSRDVRLDNAGLGTNVTSNAPGAATRVNVGYREQDGTQNNGHDIAELAAWNVADLTDEESYLLHIGVCPEEIRPRSLVLYTPLRDDIHDKHYTQLGNYSTTGTTQVDHPPVFTRGFRRTFLPSQTPIVDFGVTVVAGGVMVNPLSGRGGAAAWPLAA